MRAARAPTSAPSVSAPRARARRAPRRVAARALDCGEIACAVDDDVGAKTATINGARVSATALRRCEIVGADGARATLGRAAAGTPNVVVVLRHLA